MDEYFEQHDCLHHPSFVQLTDTLVAATLNYYNTDFGTLLETEIAQNLSGTGSRFAGLKRYGSVRLPAICSPTCSAMPPFTSCAAICLIFIWMKTA